VEQAPLQEYAKSTKMTQSVAYVASKRIFDTVFGTLFFLLSVPIILLLALAVRIETRGSPFFFQTRLGLHNKPFRIFKLRGMYIDSRQRFPELYDYSAQKDLTFHFHHEIDPRVTKVGSFIRRTSLDELPNFWNVMLGQMSMVGPRPEIPEVLALYGRYRAEYVSVKPGVTCTSKCTGRDALTKQETVDMDLQYIRDRSFGNDMSLIWKTLKSVVFRRNVY
jgi:lipopolysaccharide/colanic/teichoic acid biosynthesis glycosyltransferase